MAQFTAKHVDTKNSEKIHVLFSKRSRDEIVVLIECSHSPFSSLRANLFLEGLHEQGYKTCFTEDVRLGVGRRITVFDPETNAETPPQSVIPFSRRYYHVMHFKVPWISEKMGIKIQDTSPIALLFGLSDPTVMFIFNPNEEISTEKGAAKKEQEAERDSTYEDASTSGYGTKSTRSKLSESETWEAKSSSGIQTMISGEEAIGTALLEELERAVELRIATITEKQETDDKVRDWLESSETESEIPDILTSDDLDRELGNVSEAIIGQKGGEISLRSYRILFPPEAVKTDTKFHFRISLETELLNHPEDLIPVSLPIHCSPGNTTFTTPVRLKMPAWIRKADSSAESPPILVHTYKKCAGDEWRCAKSTELNSSGVIEVDCDHFCVYAAFIDKDDAGRVEYELQHVLYRSNLGQYASCHFVSSDPFSSSLLKYLDKKNYKIVQPPTHSSSVRLGDEIDIDIASSEPDTYKFVSENGRVLKIDEALCAMKRKESIPFLLTPYNIPRHIIEFTYRIGEKKFLMRDELEYVKQVEEETPGPSKSCVSSSKTTTATGLHNTGENSPTTVGGEARVQSFARSTVNEGNVYIGRITVVVQVVISHWALLLAIFVALLAVLLYY